MLLRSTYDTASEYYFHKNLATIYRPASFGVRKPIAGLFQKKLKNLRSRLSQIRTGEIEYETNPPLGGRLILPMKHKTIFLFTKTTRFMSTRMSIFLTMMLSLGFQASLQAQTYATPELKQKAEAEMAAKRQRIQKDPEAYRAQGGNAEQFLQAAAAKPAEKQAPVPFDAPVDLSRTDLYKLTAVDAVDVDKKHTREEMEAYQAEAEGEFLKTNIVLDWENQRWYTIPRDRHDQPEEKVFRAENGLLRFVGCQACQDNKFTIVERTENALVLQLRPQDEGQFFVFSLTFKK